MTCLAWGATGKNIAQYFEDGMTITLSVTPGQKEDEVTVKEVVIEQRRAEREIAERRIISGMRRPGFLLVDRGGFYEWLPPDMCVQSTRGIWFAKMDFILKWVDPKLVDSELRSLAPRGALHRLIKNPLVKEKLQTLLEYAQQLEQEA